VRGPVGYDLASLLRDCYIAWPVERVDAWVEQYRQSLVATSQIRPNAAQFRQWVDLAGLQRHIKVLGLFCRLNYRDMKSGYLGDLPLVLDYVLRVGAHHPELAGLLALIERATAGRDVTLASAEAPSEVA